MSPRSSEPVRAPHRPVVILLVDDDVVFQRATERILVHHGYSVVSCTSTEQALAQLQDRHFDVVLTDLHMPGTGGLGLLRAIREHGPRVPVLLMTGQPAVETAVDAVEHRARRYLVKPVPEEQLIAAIEAARGESLYPSPAAPLDSLLEPLTVRPIVSLNGSLLANELGSVWPQPADYFAQATRYILLRSDATRPYFVKLREKDLAGMPNESLRRLARRAVLDVSVLARSNPAEGKAYVARLRQLGFRVCLGQLGAGYGRLSAIAALEPDFVKLDTALVSGVHRSAAKQKVVTSVLRLALEMGQHVIADGVADEDERAALAELGCELFQGPLFGSPKKVPPHLDAHESDDDARQ